MSLVDDYGLDELRAPPILPDRERRQSLERSWSRKSLLPTKTRRERLWDDLVVASWITFLSIWGVLARLGLVALSNYPGNQVFSTVWAQFVGCGVMGFMLQDKTLFPKEDRYIALYIGLTTGFCGSLTSFSAFMWGCFSSLANIDSYYVRGRGKNVLALASQVIVTLCMSIAALRFGAHVAQVIQHVLPSLTQLRWGRHFDYMGITLAIGAWAGAAIMTALIPKWRAELFSTVFAPVGTSFTLSNLI
jgi:fluoride ion exporter CrcB/FEX